MDNIRSYGFIHVSDGENMFYIYNQPNQILIREAIIRGNRDVTITHGTHLHTINFANDTVTTDNGFVYPLYIVDSAFPQLNQQIYLTPSLLTQLREIRYDQGEILNRLENEAMSYEMSRTLHHQLDELEQTASQLLHQLNEQA